MTNFEKVKKFMLTFGQEVKNKSSFGTDQTNYLRYNLIKEELCKIKYLYSSSLLDKFDTFCPLMLEAISNATSNLT